MENIPERRADILTRWQPGQSGNPAGTTSAGHIIKLHINALAEKNLSGDEIRAIARDKALPWTRRAAAERILRTLEAGDMADFEPYLDSGEKLKSLRDKGLNTEVIKKVKTRIREIPQQDGPPITETEREIELHDRAGVDFDRVMDRTEGKPSQSLQIQGVIQHVRTIHFASGRVPDWLAAAADGVPGGSGGPALPAGQGDSDSGSSGDRQEPGVPGEVRSGV